MKSGEALRLFMELPKATQAKVLDHIKDYELDKAAELAIGTLGIDRERFPQQAREFVDTMKFLASDQPYQQGYNEHTGEVLIVFTPTDAQCALADENDDDEKYSVSAEDALAILCERGSKIVDGFLANDWEFILKICIEDEATKYKKETKLEN